jgi:hypothetical protein
MTSRCVNKLNGTILLTDATPDQVNEYIRRKCKEYYAMVPGFIFRDVTILLKAPMLVGLQNRRKKILLPFTKPCTGTFLYEVAAKEAELDFIRSALEKQSE